MTGKCYNLYLNSNDKVSGNNNNATFNINWNDFLPREYTLYNITFSFQTTGGYYKDPTGNAVVYSSAKIILNSSGRTFSFDSTTMGPSNTIGYIQRDVQTTTSASNTLSCFYQYNAPKTIVRPMQNSLLIQIFNTSLINGLLVNTDASSVAQADMTSWSMIMCFEPVENSKLEMSKILGLGM